MIRNHGWARHAGVEELAQLVQDRDAQMDDQDTYFEAAEELALRVSTLLASVRWQDRGKPQVRFGHLLYTDEIREALSPHAE